MITSYQLRKLDSGVVELFLYVDEGVEFSSEFFSKIREFNLEEFFRKKGLDLNGCKVFLVVGGVVLALIHSPIAKGNDVRFSDFVTKDTLFSEKIDIGNSKNKYGEVISYLNHFFKESSIAKLYEEKEVVNNSTEVENKENMGIVENNKNSIANSHGSNNSNKNNNNSNQENGIIGNLNQDTEKEEVKNEVAKEKVNEEDKKQEESITSAMMVQVHRSNGVVLTMEMDEYLIGVVASEMPASFSVEALKVQSILARTYAMKKIEAGLVLTDTVKTQRYMDNAEMKKMWGSGFDKYYQKIKGAVDATKGQVVLYNGALIDAVYHSTSNGKTEDSVFVWGNVFPYLVSVDSSWDRNVNGFSKTVSFTFDKLCSVFGLSQEEFSFQIVSRNKSGRVETVEVSGQTYSGVEIRTLLGLRSTDFDISYEGEQVIFQTRGYGHGVGLSQYGANEMAKNGHKYDSIIKHYYTGVNIGSVSS